MKEYGKFLNYTAFKGLWNSFLKIEANKNDITDKEIISFSVEILDNNKNHN